MTEFLTDWGVVRRARLRRRRPSSTAPLTTRWLLRAIARQRADAGDLRRRSRRARPPTSTASTRSSAIVAVVIAIALAIALDIETAIGFVIGGTLLRRRRLHRHERLRARQRARRRGRPQRRAAGARRRLQGRLGDRACWSSGLALLGVAGFYGDPDPGRQERQGGDRRADRPRLRRQPDLGVRATRRRHLHQGRRRRRRPGRARSRPASPRTTRATRP